MIPQPQCELNPGTERRGKALLGLGGAARNGGQHETLVFEDYKAKGRADRMFRSAGETAPGSWHDLPCSPPSFTNWQNFLVGMLAPLKVHCLSKPGSHGAGTLQPEEPFCLETGECTGTLCKARSSRTAFSEAEDLTSIQWGLIDKPLLCCSR